MTQKEKAETFRVLHASGEPLILFNIWDAGSAKAVADGGAKAIATGSWSVAAAYGFADGQHLPVETALDNVRRIVAAVDLPVSLDFEGGYAAEITELKENIAKVMAAGAVGINFEDQVVGGEEIYSISKQSERIQAVREVSDRRDLPLFINARTDLFLKNAPADHENYLGEAIDRSAAYAQAGANGFFAPGLKSSDLIGELCKKSPLPVNIMVMSDTPSNREMAALGVARISYGPLPYRRMIDWLTSAASAEFAR